MGHGSTTLAFGDDEHPIGRAGALLARRDLVGQSSRSWVYASYSTISSSPELVSRLVMFGWNSSPVAFSIAPIGSW
jgi:hypothetical protein